MAGWGTINNDGAMAGRPRGFETVRDMVLSMALVGAVALGLYAVVAWQRPEVQGPIRPMIDVANVVEQVDVSGPFPVQLPTDLPVGWVPTSAWFDGPEKQPGLSGSVLHIGYETPSGTYAEVKQTDGLRDYALGAWMDGATGDGVVDIDGKQWSRLVSADAGTKALVATEGNGPKVLVVVTGKADWPELTELAASLEPF